MLTPFASAAGLGWGNFLEDMIMNAQVAYSSGRAYVLTYSHLAPKCSTLILWPRAADRFVFDNFTWDRDRTDYSQFKYNGNLIPAQVPLSALISGESTLLFLGVVHRFEGFRCPDRL